MTVSSPTMNGIHMRKLSENIAIDSLRHGGLLPKHRIIMDRQESDPATVLGRWDGTRSPMPPPPNASAETIRDLDWIVAVQESATEEDIAFAKSVDSSGNHYAWWSREVGRLTGRRHPTEEFVGITDMAEGFMLALKERFDRPRPYDLGPLLGKRVEMILPDPRTPSYPSGHAFEACLCAFAMADEHPEFTTEFLLLAERVGESRVVGGVHYPSDIVAGRIAACIAHDIIRKMK